MLQLRGQRQRAPLYSGDAVSEVGQSNETFAVASTPSIETTLDDDGFSDRVMVTGTAGFAAP